VNVSVSGQVKSRLEVALPVGEGQGEFEQVTDWTTLN